jgi:hypothetical protein
VFERYERIPGGKATGMNAFAGTDDADMPAGCRPPSPGQGRLAGLRVGDIHPVQLVLQLLPHAVN